MKSSPYAEECSAEIGFQHLHCYNHLHSSVNASSLFMLGLHDFFSYYKGEYVVKNHN
jgi:hypothetical protein